MDAKQPFLSVRRTLSCNGRVLSLDVPKVMGIINVNSDSFYSPSRFRFSHSIARRANAIIQQGGDIIDIGACSTRPGAKPISEAMELKHLSKAMRAVRKRLPDAIVSIDTYRASVARAMVNDFGASIINDISAGNMDPQMLPTIAELKVPYILTHMQGTPEDMQNNPTYKDVVVDITTFFAEKLNALRKLGINDIILDPGFGFGKSPEHNFTLLNKMDSFRVFELPIMVGISRKSMVYKTLNTSPRYALNGTTVLNTIALTHGAKILRVHDVEEAVQAVKLTQLLRGSN